MNAYKHIYGSASPPRLVRVEKQENHQGVSIFSRDRDKTMDGGKSMPDHIMIACAVCLAEIPASVARVFEAQDYIQHFCGIDCYKQWQDGQVNS